MCRMPAFHSHQPAVQRRTLACRAQSVPEHCGTSSALPATATGDQAGYRVELTTTVIAMTADLDLQLISRHTTRHCQEEAARNTSRPAKQVIIYMIHMAIAVKHSKSCSIEYLHCRGRYHPWVFQLIFAGGQAEGRQQVEGQIQEAEWQGGWCEHPGGLKGKAHPGEVQGKVTTWSSGGQAGLE